MLRSLAHSPAKWIQTRSLETVDPRDGTRDDCQLLPNLETSQGVAMQDLAAPMLAGVAILDGLERAGVVGIERARQWVNYGAGQLILNRARLEGLVENYRSVTHG